MKSTVCLHFRVVEQALIETSSTYLDAGDLTDLIITQLTPIVEQGVSNESANLQESVDLQNFELQVVQEVSQSLKPTIIRIIQVTVAGMHTFFKIYKYIIDLQNR